MRRALSVSGGAERVGKKREVHAPVEVERAVDGARDSLERLTGGGVHGLLAAVAREADDVAPIGRQGRR